MLRLRIFLKLGVASVILLAFLIVLLNGLLVQQGDATIVVEAVLPEVPDKLYVLRSIPLELSLEDMANVASMFGVNGEARFVNGAWKIEKDSKELLVYKSGNLRFFHNSEMWNNGYERSQLPTTPECINIADRLLSGLRAKGLIFRDLGLSFTDTAVDTSEYFNTNGTRVTLVNNVHVNFALSYDEMPLWGAQAKVRVYVGKDGEVIGFIGDFWRVEPSDEVSILTPAEAVEKLGDIGYGMSMSKDMVERATVKSVSLVYMPPSPESESVSITPVYVVSGTLLGKDGSTGELFVIVDAVRR